MKNFPHNREITGLKSRLVLDLKAQFSVFSIVSDLLYKRQKSKYPGINLKYL